MPYRAAAIRWGIRYYRLCISGANLIPKDNLSSWLESSQKGVRPIRGLILCVEEVLWSRDKIIWKIKINLLLTGALGSKDCVLIVMSHYILLELKNSVSKEARSVWTEVGAIT